MLRNTDQKAVSYVSSSQSKKQMMVFTREKNDTSNKNRQ